MGDVYRSKLDRAGQWVVEHGAGEGVDVEG